jgi:hypothetical protein
MFSKIWTGVHVAVAAGAIVWDVACHGMIYTSLGVIGAAAAARAN